MKVEQIYTGCLSQASYYVESDGEAVVIDPLREVDYYIQKAKNSSSKIKFILQTHFHADFVSGHITLSKLTGAPIVYGPNADPSYDVVIANDNDVFNFGKVYVKLIHTPGHTLESSCFLLFDENNKQHSIFTGDTLFLGDVGIPDVAQRYEGLSKEELAATLFDSINNKIRILDSNITVYPGHGAGSACGKRMMKETVDTLSNQKIVNYALNGSLNKNQFVNELTSNLPEPPAYFPQNVLMNKNGYIDFSDILKKSNRALTADEFKILMLKKNTVILDTRSTTDFSNAHIPGSYFIGLSGNFAPWVGEILKDVTINILLVAEKGKEIESITRLSRVGFDNCIGYLKDGIYSWVQKGNLVDKINNISPKDFTLLKGDFKTLDVRKKSETKISSLDNSKKIPLSDIHLNLDSLNKKDKIYVHCAGGYRSMIALSILKRNGFNNIFDINEGYKGIQQCLVQ